MIFRYLRSMSPTYIVLTLQPSPQSVLGYFHHPQQKPVPTSIIHFPTNCDLLQFPVLGNHWFNLSIDLSILSIFLQVEPYLVFYDWLYIRYFGEKHMGGFNKKIVTLRLVFFLLEHIPSMWEASPRATQKQTDKCSKVTAVIGKDRKSVV